MTEPRWSTEQLAWMAGLLEGEGHFGISQKTSKDGYTYPVFRISCNMTDLDVLERLHRTAGVGNLSGAQKGQKPHHSTFWRWIVNKRADVHDLCAALLPWMGERRSRRIREIVAVLEKTDRSWQHGTRWGYERGCRCASCRGAHAARHRGLRERRRQRSALLALSE